MTATRPKPKATKASQRKPLGTIWEVPDSLWERILPLLQEFWPTKASVLVDGDGGPLGVVIAAANVNDQKLLRETIEAIVVDRPEPTADDPQNLCLDAAYDNPTGREATAQAKYTPHLRRVRQEKKP